jgi:HSP20 family protein
MSDDIRYLKELRRQSGSFIYERMCVQFSKLYSTETWQPAINAYGFRDCIQVIVELAGVEPAAIEVRVAAGRLTIRGRRAAPEPCEARALQILAMEIDAGPFEREVLLPADVDEQKMTFEQRNGLLWIRLPLVPPESRTLQS